MLSGDAFAVVECVTNFDHSVFELINHMFLLVFFVVDPVQFGHPAHRRRKYMVLLNKQKLRWHDAIAADVPGAFRRMFASGRCTLPSSVFLHAPKGMIQQDTAARMQRRGFPATRRKGKSWSCFQSLSHAVRKQILAHEQAARQAGHPERAPLYADLRQRPNFIPPVDRIPALLRRTLLWSLERRRLLLGGEAMEIQGVGPVYFSSDYTNADEIGDIGPDEQDAPLPRTPFIEALRSGTSFTAQQIISLAGNGMTVPVVGLVLGFVTACTVPV